MLALAAVVPPASASQTSEKTEKATRNRLAPDAPTDSYRINDGFYSKTYNHLGNPARGIVVADTWGETGWVSTGTGDVADNTQGFARALLLRRALRVAVRVELWGASDTSADLITGSSTVNSSGNPTVQLATPRCRTSRATRTASSGRGCSWPSAGTTSGCPTSASRCRSGTSTPTAWAPHSTQGVCSAGGSPP